jgi:5'-deoxynucleotidase YfbR-like HD superfamily hydrolase
MVDFVDFFHDIGRLKKVKRTGWVREGVPMPESVAEHIFRVSVMALILGKKKGLNTERLVRMALLHDVSEAHVGDRVWERGTKVFHQRREAKEEAETASMKELSEKIKDKEVFELWNDFMQRKSPEAQFIKQLDKLEMAFQAYEYELEHDKDLSEFFENVRPYLTDPDLLKIFEELVKKRR